MFIIVFAVVIIINIITCIFYANEKFSESLAMLGWSCKFAKHSAMISEPQNKQNKTKQKNNNIAVNVILLKMLAYSKSQ